jgi:hypothetical protein
MYSVGIGTQVVAKEDFNFFNYKGTQRSTKETLNPFAVTPLRRCALLFYNLFYNILIIMIFFAIFKTLYIFASELRGI